MAKTIRFPLDQIKTAEGKQTMFGQLYGNLDWEMDEFVISWESGKENILLSYVLIFKTNRWACFWPLLSELVELLLTRKLSNQFASLSILPYVFLQRYQRCRLISANVLVLFRSSVESVNYSLWVNHSLLILHIYYTQSRMGQPGLMVLFLFLD